MLSPGKDARILLFCISLAFNSTELVLYWLTDRLIFDLPHSDCTNGWHRYRTGCIKFFTTSKTRSEARIRCTGFKTSNDIQGDLIKIPSSVDNDLVVSLAPQTGVWFLIYLEPDTQATSLFQAFC